MNSKDQLYQMLAQSDSTLFRGGAIPQMPPFPGLSFLGPQAGQLFNMFLPQITDMLGNPFGRFAFNFSGNQNIMHTHEARRWMQETMIMRRAVADADVPLLSQGFRGIYSSMASAMGADVFLRNPDGTRTLKPEYSSMIDRMAQNFAPALPIIAAIAPDSIDRIAGQTGLKSAAADLFFSSSRYVIGRGGIPDGKASAQLLDLTFEDIYGPEGAPKSSRRVSGLSSRRVGELFSELTNRGIIQSGDTDDIEGIAKQASEQIQKYSKAIAAVKDIFDANGMTDAPMAQLVGSLKDITNLSMGAARPEDIAKAARDFQGAARYSSLGFEGLATVSRLAGAMAGQMGIRTAATSGMAADIAAVTTAAQRLGYNANATTDVMTADEFLGAEMNRRMGARKSPLANTIGAILSMGDLAGEDTAIGKVAQRLKAGDLPPELADGRAQSYIAQLARDSGIDPSALFAQIYHGEAANANAIARDPRAMRAVEGAGQRTEFRMKLGARLSSFGADAGKIIDEIMKAAPAANSDIDLINRVATAMGRGNDLAYKASLSSAFSMFHTDEARQAGLAPGSDEAKAKSVLGQSRMLNEQIGELEKENRMQGDMYGFISQMLEAEGKGGLIGRAWKEFVRMGGNADPNDKSAGGTFQSMLRILGMVTNDDVGKAIGPEAAKGVMDLLGLALPGGGKEGPVKEAGKEKDKEDVKQGIKGDNANNQNVKTNDGSEESKPLYVKIVDERRGAFWAEPIKQDMKQAAGNLREKLV